MNKDAIRKTVAQSLAGEIVFPQVVERLLGEGVESYHVDLVRLEERFYAADGKTHVEKMDLQPLAIAGDFDADGVVSAIRDSRARKIAYRDFLERIAASGTSYYIAFLDGKKVTYLGRASSAILWRLPGDRISFI